jgi:hypothetical protein
MGPRIASHLQNRLQRRFVVVTDDNALTPWWPDPEPLEFLDGVLGSFDVVRVNVGRELVLAPAVVSNRVPHIRPMRHLREATHELIAC